MPDRNVLFITPFYPPCGGPGVQRVLKFTRYLRRLGWRSTVLTAVEPLLGEDASLLDEVPEDVTVIRRLAPRRKHVAAVARRCVTALTWPMCRAIGKQGDWLGAAVEWRVWRLASKLIVPDWTGLWALRCMALAPVLARGGRFDAVITSGPPHSTHLAGLAVRRATGTPWVADFRDPWVGNFCLDPSAGLPYRLARVLEPIVLDAADVVLQVTERNVRFARRLGRSGPRRHVTLLRNGFDRDDLPVPADGDPAEQAREFRIHYNGALYGPQSGVYVLRAIAAFLARRPDARAALRFTLTGLPDRERDEACRLGIDDVVEDVGLLEHRRSLEACRDAGALLLVQADGPGTLGVVPGKTYEYLAMGRPILAAVCPGGEVEQLLRPHSEVYLAGFRDVEAIAARIEELWDRWREDPAMTVSPPRSVDRYDRRRQTERLGTILDRLVRARQAGRGE